MFNTSFVQFKIARKIMIPQHIHDSDRLASISSKVYKGILKHKMNKNENVMFILRYEIKGYLVFRLLKKVTQSITLCNYAELLFF